MKSKSIFKHFLIVICVLLLANSYAYAKGIEGAWLRKEGDRTFTLLVLDGYFSLTEYELEGKKFISTYGGVLSVSGNKLTGKLEFHSLDKAMVGTSWERQIAVDKESFSWKVEGKEEKWIRYKEVLNDLIGVWRISAREQNGTMNAIQPAARKTYKILTGSRFQWIAMNTQTGEFSGTGGGSYTFKEGVYTENIEFFSRDNNRVGAILNFMGSVKGDDWDHSGKSSKGDPIHEIWTRVRH
jgi:hypothetical protein